MLELKNLDSGYDFLQVLWQVSFTVEEGEFIALIGPNGAGKSTTLRTITGLIKPMGGDILFNGESIVNKPPHVISRMGISYVSEALNLFTDMSVQENLLMGAYAVKERETQCCWKERIKRQGQ